MLPTTTTTTPIKVHDNDNINHNLNNNQHDPMRVTNDVPPSRETIFKRQVRLITTALDVMNNPRGVTLKEIRRCLASAGLIGPRDDLRRPMVMALEQGHVFRAPWAARYGIYGVYVRGDGVPIHAGRNKKSRGSRSKKTHPSRRRQNGAATKWSRQMKKKKKRREGRNSGTMLKRRLTGAGSKKVSRSKKRHNNNHRTNRRDGASRRRRYSYRK